jgi:hypothetical protein
VCVIGKNLENLVLFRILSVLVELAISNLLEGTSPRMDDAENLARKNVH